MVIGIKYWGPLLWYVLHKVCHHYPTIGTLEQKQLYMSFFNITTHIIPCNICKSHYHSSIGRNMLHLNLGSRIELIEWFRKQHNNVNISHKRRELEIDEVLLLYNSALNHDIVNKLIDYLYVLVVNCEIDRENFVKWILLLYKVFPCNDCESRAQIFFKSNNLNTINYRNNNVLRQWIMGLRISTTH